jgi:cytochrome c1
MSDRWVVDPDHPSGYLVPMTPDEQAWCDTNQAAGLAAMQRDAAAATVRASITSGLVASIDKLTTSRAALAGGTIFATLTQSERATLDAILRANLQLARLALSSFDTPTP